MLRFLSTLSLVVVLAAPVLAQQDVVTVGTVSASGNTVDVPVSIRDVSGTPLGIDRPAGSKIQAFSIRVNYSPANAVASITFARAGITAPLTPTSEFTPATPGSISILDVFQESTNPIPFTLNAPPPGNQVAHLVVTLASNVTAGSTITLALDPSLTQLTDDGGTAATKESVANGNLALVDGAINIPQPSLQLTPFSQDITPGGTASIHVVASANLAADATITIDSSDTSVATAPPTVVMSAGTKTADFNVTGIALGTTTITATFPANIGGASGSARVNVVANCSTPAVPQIAGPASADAGATYTITWPAISGATDYSIDESTDQTFATATTTKTVTTNSASFSHATGNVRYYYRVRAHNGATGCNVSSNASNAVSVLVNAVPVPQTRILTVVGSAPGTNGAFFKTSVQLYNPKTTAISGKIVYHPQGVSGSASDPTLAYTLQPKKTLTYADLLPAIGAASGVGSADLVADAGSSFPLTLVRVFNDGGAAGTTGLALEPFSLDDALQAGNSGSLIAPDDVVRFRLNIGVRTLTSGVTTSVTVRDKDGAAVASVTKTFGPTFFTQLTSTQILDGYVLKGGETITFDVTSGSAFIYGSTTDNTTNDPSVQFAKRSE